MTAVSAPDSGRVLSAPLRVAFDYTRSTGPVLGAFMTALRERRVVGIRTSDDRVVVPPVEFDPVTYAPLSTDDLVPVADHGTVITWTWVSEPVAGQPLSEPFAFALITLDGATAPLLHAIKAPGPCALTTGQKVRAVWSDTPQGHITDIRFFEPVAEPSEVTEAAPSGPGAATTEPVTGIVTPVELDYVYEASPEESAFFRGLAEGRILGQRCPTCHKVYVPPRGACPVDGVPTTDEVELPDHGIVTTYCVVNVPFLGQKIKPPYVSAYVLLEGADIGFLHLIQGVAADEVRMGMRVKAVWKPREEWGTTVENILHFEPTGEPDADFESFRAHL
jgi:uncharacterized OB-fold protein